MATKKMTTTLKAGKTFITGLLPLSLANVLRVSRSGMVYKKASSGLPAQGEFRHTGVAILIFSTSEPGNAGGEPVTIVYKE